MSLSNLPLSMKSGKSCAVVAVIFFSLFLVFNSLAFAQEDPQVKMSSSGVCHEKGKSQYYEKTKKFTPFKSIDECLKAGGKLPKR